MGIAAGSRGRAGALGNSAACSPAPLLGLLGTRAACWVHLLVATWIFSLGGVAFCS